MSWIVQMIMQQQALEAAERQQAAARQHVTELLGTPGTPGQFLLPEGMAGPQRLPEGGTGLLADVSDPTRQAAFAGGLLMLEPTRDAGTTLMDQVFADQANMDRVRANNIAAMEREVLQQSTSAGIAQRKLEQDAAQFERTFSQRAALAQLNRQQQAQLAQAARPGTGYYVHRDPSTGQIMGHAMIPGSEPYQQAQGAAIETRNVYGVVRDIIDQVISADGPEAFGEISGKLGAQYGQVISHLLKIRGFGAPQAAEFERLEEMLTDPASLTAAAGFKRKSTIASAYIELARELERSYQMQQQLAGFTFIPELSGPLPALPTDRRRATEAGLRPVERPPSRPALRSPGGPLSEFAGGS